MGEQVKKSQKRNKLIIALVAGALVFATAVGILLFFLLNPANENVGDEGTYLLYWNLDRDQYAGQAADGKTSREADADGFYNIRLGYRGRTVVRKTTSREIANEIDSYEILGLTMKDGIITDVLKVEDFTGGYACDGKRVYVASIQQNSVVATVMKGTGSEGEYTLTLAEDANVYDVSGETEPIGGISVLRADDRFLAVMNKQGEVSDIFIISRADLGNIRYAYCEHCKQEVKWIGWEKITVLPAADSGHYFLMNDIVAKAQTSIQADTEIILDLNGKTIQGKEDNRVFSLHNQGCYLAIMDSSEEKSGQVVAGESMLLIHQGACVWVRYGVFELYGGTLDASAAYSVNNGAAVCVPKDAVFNMYGGTITGGTISTKFDPTTQKTSAGMGGNVYVAGTFNMYGGLITKGKAESYYFRDTGTYTSGLGGNVYIAANATFTMTGGELRGGTSHGGGANVFVNAYATFNMSGDAKITGGKTIRPGKNGGSVYVAAKGIFNMDGGSIDGGGTTNRGGNLVLYGVLNMTGGSITNGRTLDADLNETIMDYSNVFVVNGEVNMSGGYINGHVYLQNANENTYNVNLSGTAQIKDAADGYANLYIRGGHPIHIDKLADGAEIHVTASGVFTTETAEANKKYIHLDYPDVGVVYYEKCLYAGRMGCLCGAADGKHFGECDGKQVPWGAWSSKTSLPTTTGNYYLLYDVDLSGQISVANEATIALDLNGKTVKATKDGRVYSLHATEVPVSITITDSSKAQTGKMVAASVETMNEGLLFWLRRSEKPHTLTIYGGTFDASGVVNAKNGAAIHGTEGSTINIHGGTIIGGTTKSTWNEATAGFGGGRGGTIYTTGNLIMTGGTIKGGKAEFTTQNVQVKGEDGKTSVVVKTGDAYGGNIVLAGNFAVGTFTGGTIEGGNAVLGGNIYIGNKSAATLAGVTVKDGTAQKNGGNIYMGQQAHITMTSGQILGGQNTAEGANGGSVYICGNSKDGDAVFVLKGGIVSGGKAMNMGGNFDVRGMLQVDGGEIKNGLAQGDKTDAPHSNIAVVNLGTQTNNGKLVATGGHIHGGVNAQTQLGEVFSCIAVSGTAKITAPKGYLGVTLRGDAYIVVDGLKSGAEIWVNQTVGRQVAVAGTIKKLTNADTAFFKHETGYYTLRDDGKIYLERAVKVTTAQQLHDALQAGYSVTLGNDIVYDASKIVDNTAIDEAPGVINARNKITMDMGGYTITYIPAADTNTNDKIPAANKFINLMGTCELTITGNGKFLHKAVFADADNAAMFRVAAGLLNIENGVFISELDGITSVSQVRYMIWNSGSGVVKIADGTFSNAMGREIANDENVTITGGKFATSVKVAEGYYLSGPETDGLYHVKQGTEPPMQMNTAQALKKALEAGKAVVLEGDITYDLNANITCKLDASLDLNGYTITWANNTRIDVYSGSTLTVSGNGSIVQNNGKIFRVSDRGQLVIKGGTFTASDNIIHAGGNDLDSVTITGGTFNGTVYSYQGKLAISGGTFKGAVNAADDVNCHVTGGLYTVQFTSSGIEIPDGYWLSGPDADRMFQVLPGSEPAGPFEASTAQQMHDLLQMGRDVILTGNIEYIASDILDEGAGADATSIIKISDAVKLDLAGYTVTYVPNGGANKFFELSAGGDLTITGNGTILQKVILADADNAAMFRVAAGTLTIENGNFLSVYEGIDNCATKRYIIWNGGSGIVNIEGGVFSNDCTRVIAEATGATITGGKFSSDPTAYGVDLDNYSATIITEGGKTWYEVLSPAQVSTAQQLKDAIESGRSVVLVQDITYDLGSITSKRIVNLDLGEYTITWDNANRIDVNGGKFTVTATTGGIVQNNGSIFRVNGATLNLMGGSYTASDRVVWSGGNDAESVNVYNGTFNGKLQAYSGEMVISGGTFNKQVYTSDNDMVAELTISGGTFNDLVTVHADTICTISGGSFKDSPDAYLALGYAAVVGDDGMYRVEAFATVTTAQELKEALEAGENIKLGDALTVDAAIVLNGKDAVLDLNGKQLTISMNDQLADAFITLVDSKLTICDTSALKSGQINAVYGNNCTIAMPVIKVATADSKLVVESAALTYAFADDYTGTPAGKLNIIDSNGSVVIADGLLVNSVNGETVNGISGSISINGGVFSKKPASDAATVVWKTGHVLMKPAGESLYSLVAIPDGYTVISDAAGLKQAMASGEKAWLINDITFADNSTNADTSGAFINITGGKASAVDLNGFKVTFNTDSTLHVIQLNNAQLTFEDNSSAKSGVVEVAYNGGAAHFIRVNGTDTLYIEDGITLQYVLAQGVTQAPASGNRNLIHSNGSLVINGVLDNQIGGEVYRQWGANNVTLNGGRFNKQPAYNGDWTGSVLPQGVAVTEDDGWYVVKQRQERAVATAAELKTYLEQGMSVYLTSDITVSNSDYSITISNKMTEFTLDLNGHTITANIEKTTAVHLFNLTKCRLRITDTSLQKNGGIVARYASGAADNTGVFRVNNGASFAYLTIDAGSFTFEKATSHVRTNCRFVYCSGSTTINGGTFSGFANDMVFCFTSEGIVNVNGGSFVTYKPRAASGGTVVLKSGYQWTESSPYTLEPISG